MLEGGRKMNGTYRRHPSYVRFTRVFKSVTDTENTKKSVQSILDKEDGVRREWFDCSNFCGMAVQSC